MARFSRLQYWQLIVFCLYWFLFFPIIWFLVSADFFSSSVFTAILLAVILLFGYCLLYCIIKCCCNPKESSASQNRFWPSSTRRGAENPVYSPTTTTTTITKETKPKTNVRKPNAVVYESVPPNQKPGLVCIEEPLMDEERKNVRFITSCSLYYDGQDFIDA